MIMKNKTKKILRFPCFLASYCLSLDDKVNTIPYQQFTLALKLTHSFLGPKTPCQISLSKIVWKTCHSECHFRSQKRLKYKGNGHNLTYDFVSAITFYPQHFIQFRFHRGSTFSLIFA